MNIDYAKLIHEAIAMREASYSPYSDFAVGAALLTSDGKIYRGCNIENAAFTPTNCAERTAFFTAVAAGERNFTALAVVGWARGGKPDYAFPCGVCRQVMMEFCDPKSFLIIVATSGNTYKEMTLEELLPKGFSSENLYEK